MQRSPADILRQCIDRCANGRGRARDAKRSAARQLGGSVIDQQAAEAARRIGLWLKATGR